MSSTRFLQPRSLVVGERVFVRDDDYVWLPAMVVECQPDRVLVRIDLPQNWNESTMAVANAGSNTNNKNNNKDGPGRKKKAKSMSSVMIHKKGGMERWIELNDYKDRQLPIQNDSVVRDMADLCHLHEAAVLYQIKQRYLTQKPYTRVGDIVVAMNPCQWIPELYSVNQQHFYAKNFIWNGTRSILYGYINM